MAGEASIFRLLHYRKPQPKLADKCKKSNKSVRRLVFQEGYAYTFNEYKEIPMPRIAIEDNSRMSLRIRAEEKALLLRAVALKQTDLTGFVLRHALSAARAVIHDADRVQLSARDSLRVLDLLENPPAPNERLRAAAKALPQRP
jgi:uncharacterized protein (DUF1778 family)